MIRMSEIRSALKRVKNPVMRERLLMVQAALKQPLREAAKQFGCVHGKVDYWKKRYEAKGLRGLGTKPRSGRPKKISAEQESMLKRQVRKHNVTQGWRTKNVRHLIYEKAGVQYSFRHTIRILHQWGLSKIKPRPRYAFSKQEEREQFIKKTDDTWHVNPLTGRSSLRTKASSPTR